MMLSKRLLGMPWTIRKSSTGSLILHIVNLDVGWSLTEIRQLVTSLAAICNLMQLMGVRLVPVDISIPSDIDGRVFSTAWRLAPTQQGISFSYVGLVPGQSLTIVKGLEKKGKINGGN